MSTYRNLQGQTFEEPEPGSWYNLATKRKITKSRDGYILYANPRVAGTSDMIDQFLSLNNLQTKRPAGPRSEYTPRTIETPNFYGIPIPKFFQRPASPPPLKKLEAPSCPLQKAGTTLYRPETTEIEKVPLEELEALCEFNLTGLHVKARVLHIVDGDTLDLAFYIPLAYLATPRYQGKKLVRSILVPKEEAGFFTRMRVRLSEIDTAEKNTTKGQLAKRLLERRIAALNGFVYAHFIKFEKYGRLLADVFADKEETVNLKSELLGFRHPVLGPVAVPYFGAKKEVWPTTPPKFILEKDYLL